MRQPWIYIVCMAFVAVIVTGCDASHKTSEAGGDKATVGEGPVPAEQPDTTPDSAQGDTDDSASADQAATDNSNLWVMQARGNRQCEGGGRTLEASAAQLAENGIKVQESRCATRTDRMYPSVCGGATGDLMLHRIPSDFLDAALELGFDPAKPGSYQLGDCPKVQSGGSSSVY
ncbi:hypothetical protein [Microbulbifer elongatus]|uniref:hypothetical protein n=1 Tax=Microbulbifer elongatus TaxID=86173 RepID=UPI001E54EA61|nr:hypothetical protein [Microbulbifer elongatus]